MRSLLRFPLVLALGLSSSALLAQDVQEIPVPPQQQPAVRTPQPPKPPAPTGSIHGTVYCGDTHKPARGALVMAQGLPSNKEPQNGNPGLTRTAMDGSYTIANIAEGEYGVVAFLPGYLSPFDNISAEEMEGDAAMFKRFAAAGTATVTAHQSASHDITLTRGATISGRVMFSDGSPATQVNITLEDINAKPRTPKPGQPDIDFSTIFKTMFTHQSDGTDDEGHFRISGISPSTYRVAAVSASTMNVDGDGEDGMGTILGGMFSDPNALHVYSGDTLHKNAAKTYELRAGDNVSGVDIVIPLNAFHQVRGILSAVDGRAINTATITLVDATDDTLHFTSKLGADGGFSFPTVPSGTYKLSATNPRIMAPDPNSPAFPARFAPKIPVAAFADGNTTLIVKDADLLDIVFNLTEIPVPANETKPNNQTTPPPPPE